MVKVEPTPDPNEYKLFAMKLPFVTMILIKIFVGGFNTAKSLVVFTPLAVVPSQAWDLIPVKVIGDYLKTKYNVQSMRVAGKKIRFACPFW
jgi:hypothetical protein